MTGPRRKSRRTRRAPLTRSEIMARVRSRNTGPERTVRRALWAAGLRYRLHDAGLPGKPDIVFRSRKIVLFVHGCFWHGHQGCSRHRIPKSRTEGWIAKIDRNRERDAEVQRTLEAAGWAVIALWECEVADAEHLAELVAAIKNISSATKFVSRSK